MGGEKGSNTPTSSRRLVRCMNAFLCPESRTAAPACPRPSGHERTMVSHDRIGFYLLSKLFRATARWCPSEQGADEVFGGCTTGIRPCRQRPAWYRTTWRSFVTATTPNTRRPCSRSTLTGDCSPTGCGAHFAGAGADDPVEGLRLDTTVMLVDDPSSAWTTDHGFLWPGNTRAFLTMNWWNWRPVFRCGTSWRAAAKGILKGSCAQGGAFCRD